MITTSFCRRFVRGLQAERFGVGQATSKFTFFTVCLVVGVMPWGCGPKVHPDMIQVTGQVALAGKLLPEAAICFKGDDNGFSETARIDGGKFRAALKAGSYSVAVIAQEELFDERGISTGFRQLIPIRYFTTTSSGLEATVDPDHRSIDIQLEP